MKTQISETFDKCRQDRRPAFIAYIAAGDPDYDTSLKIACRLASAGVDILELGIPFSDPLADGEANQLAASRALDAGMTPLKTLDLAADIRKNNPSMPIVLFTYINPIAHSGDFPSFCKTAVDKGIDAVLTLDLPPEEALEYREHMDIAGLPLVSLVAPTTPERRLPLLASHANAFIYYVCREGVTGERRDFASGVSEKISMIRKYTDLPVVAGFGISSPEQVAKAAEAGVDGVVVGSAIVRKIEALSKGESTLDELGAFVKSLCDALKK